MNFNNLFPSLPLNRHSFTPFFYLLFSLLPLFPSSLLSTLPPSTPFLSTPPPSISPLSISTGSTNATDSTNSIDNYTQEEKQILSPWYTGPLIAGSGYILPTSIINIQPYLYVLCNSSFYDNHWKSQKLPDSLWLIQPAFSFSLGITSWMDCSIDCSLSHVQESGFSLTRIADTDLTISFQLYTPSENSPWPALRLALRETFPTGDYIENNIGSFYLFSSAGFYQSWIGLAASKLTNFFHNHPLDFRLNIFYNKNSHLTLIGESDYGGAPDTNGTLKPGDSYLANAAIEFSLTKHWVLAFDILYIHQNEFRFSGNPGYIDGQPVILTFPSSELLSFAPAIEYNVNLNFGFLLASWFSVIGRNNTQFAGGAFSFVYNF